MLYIPGDRIVFKSGLKGIILGSASTSGLYHIKMEEPLPYMQFISGYFWDIEIDTDKEYYRDIKLNELGIV